MGNETFYGDGLTNVGHTVRLIVSFEHVCIGFTIVCMKEKRLCKVHQKRPGNGAEAETFFKSKSWKEMERPCSRVVRHLPPDGW